MYFEVENTPEHIKRSRQIKKSVEGNTEDECPCLITAPFSRPPKVLFENVLVGTSAERLLDVYNPSQRVQQISLGKEPPPGLVVGLPNSKLLLDPCCCYRLTLQWTPMQPTAQRETIHFTDDGRGRYDVIIVLQSMIPKTNRKVKPKNLRKTPNNVTKKVFPAISKQVNRGVLKSSPTVVTKSKIYAMCQSVPDRTAKVTKYSYKENASPPPPLQYRQRAVKACPFDSPASMNSADSFNFNTFNTSEVFPKRDGEKYQFQDAPTAYKEDNDELLAMFRVDAGNNPYIAQNILTPSKKHNPNCMVPDIFDDLKFTPLKSLPSVKDNNVKSNTRNTGDSDPDDSLENQENCNPRETHLLIPSEHTHTQNPTAQWVNGIPEIYNAFTDNRYEQNYSVNESAMQSKKIPNTSSPKHHGSPDINFTLNTEVSCISNDFSFFPQRFSTEKKILIGKEHLNEYFIRTPNAENRTTSKVGFETFNKPDSPQTYPYPNTAKTSANFLGVQPLPQLNPKSNHARHQLRFQEQVPKYQPLEGRNCGNGARNVIEANLWQSDRSPPRSLSPPLQSIPEESTQFSQTKCLDETNQQATTFTINRTFDKPSDNSCSSSKSKQLWLKKSVRCETDLWKIPKSAIKVSSSVQREKPEKVFDDTTNLSYASLYRISDVYSQSTTVDPFLSATYFYDEEAVKQFELEFKRWLNYILTPPADLEHVDEQKIDIGQAWIENRNKEIPVAPTREQVSNTYHNSHRLESLRKAARALIMSPGMTTVFVKLNAQIEKKLVAIRNDKHLHLDVGLQKVVLNLLLCYNPLWLRIGLEAVYGLIIPLSSNNDIFGLTSFIIHRMFKDPYLKSKQMGNAPNMLMPSYIASMKKFTLKKYFMLVFFLDQAKQKKLILHDPCLFCRNAPYKESRDLLIKFTRELITGIGDITKHLRPLGYVVCHKQSYLDEFKYAVHNVAVDLKDGVRLSKVMEVILVKNGIMSNVRTPAISRLQKIHNVQLALNALKEANFTIVGDISARDIADGHREKTLSLLWQIIHVFRAPLFEKAANVIQIWWKKKYKVIIVKRQIEQEREHRRHIAASTIQCWWRRIQYSRFVEQRMQQFTAAAITLQKYCRMWICQSQLTRYKKAALRIEQWYISAKQIKQAEEILQRLLTEQRSVSKLQAWYRRTLKAKRVLQISHLYQEYCKETRKRKSAVNIIKHIFKRNLVINRMRKLVFVCIEHINEEKQKHKAAIVIQSNVRMWLCLCRYRITQRHIVLVQSIIRGFIVRGQMSKVTKYVVHIQQKFRSKKVMKVQSQMFTKIRRSTIILQSYYRMLVQRKYYQKLKLAVNKVEERYVSLLMMRRERKQFIQMRVSATKIQSKIRAIQSRKIYLQNRKAIVNLQLRFRANMLMKAQKTLYLETLKSVTTIQRYMRAQLVMRQLRAQFLKLKKCTIFIQHYVRSYFVMKREQNIYLSMKKNTINLQRRYRANLEMKKARSEFLKIKTSCIITQKRYRSLMIMRKQQKQFQAVRLAAVTIQRRFRALLDMRYHRDRYLQIRSSALLLQWHFKAYKLKEKQRNQYIQIRKACLVIQQHFKLYKEMKSIRQNYLRLREACIVVQIQYRANILMRVTKQKYITYKSSVVLVQRRYRGIIERRKCEANYKMMRAACITIQARLRAQINMRTQRNKYQALRKSAYVIQAHYKAYLLGKKQREEYVRIKKACIVIQTRFRLHKEMKYRHTYYLSLRRACLVVQRLLRAKVNMRVTRQEYTRYREAVICVQRKYRAKILQRECETKYKSIRSACIIIQARFRAQTNMLSHRKKYLTIKNSAHVIQIHYRAFQLGKKQREAYLQTKMASSLIQQRFKSYREMRKTRNDFLTLKQSCIVVQRRFRAKTLMLITKQEYTQYKNAVIFIQRIYRAKLLGRSCKARYTAIQVASKTIQARFRAQIQMQTQRHRYVACKKAALVIKRHYKAKKLMNQQLHKYQQIRDAVILLQTQIRHYLIMNKQRKYFLDLKRTVIQIQRHYRSKLIMRQSVKKLQLLKAHTINIQQRYRAKLLTRDIRSRYLQQKIACNRIKLWYRATKAMQKQKLQYSRVIQSITAIQQIYRAKRLMVEAKKEYSQIRLSAIMVQQRWRANKLCRAQRQKYIQTLNSIIKIQIWYRSIVNMRQVILEYNKLKVVKKQNDAAKCIQTWYRSVIITRQYQNSYLTLKRSVITLQTYYRMYKVVQTQRNIYQQQKYCCIKIQSWIRCWLQRRKYLQLQKSICILQAAYRQKTKAQHEKQQRELKEKATVCIQRCFRRYIAVSRYKTYRKHTILVQRKWRSILITRQVRERYVLMRSNIIKLQAVARGYIVRKNVENTKIEIQAQGEQQRLHWAASKIQALFRGHYARSTLCNWQSVVELRQRWRSGALQSSQQTMHERNQDAMEALFKMNDIANVIRAFVSLELLTEVYPMIYHETGKTVVNYILKYMQTTNRSVSCMETLKSTGAILVNLARYRNTGAQIYNRRQIDYILKFMLRWSSSNTQLFCVYATYVWLFSKYSHAREDLVKFLHESENLKLMNSMKTCIMRNKKMADNRKTWTPRVTKKTICLNSSLKNFNRSINISPTHSKPILEPDYGIVRADKPRYFQCDVQAIEALFAVYNLKSGPSNCGLEPLRF